MADSIPHPPKEFYSDHNKQFLPSEELDEWVRNLFIDENAELYNEDHEHLNYAWIGWLWSTAINTSKGRRVLGMAEIFNARCNKWQKARQEQQLQEWFGRIPEFIITIDANYWKEAGNPERFALIEHELYHCAQAQNEFGAPRFNQSTGLPVWSIQGHDVEEFVGVVQRYGAEATRVKQMINAANKGPTIAHAKIDGLCGTCERRVA